MWVWFYGSTINEYSLISEDWSLSKFWKNWKLRPTNECLKCLTTYAASARALWSGSSRPLSDWHLMKLKKFINDAVRKCLLETNFSGLENCSCRTPITTPNFGKNCSGMLIQFRIYLKKYVWYRIFDFLQLFVLQNNKYWIWMVI